MVAKMDAKKFINRLDQFKPAFKEDFEDFKKLIEDYPFFQPAMVYLLKGINHHQPDFYSFLLQQTASMTHDRSLLHRWINNPVPRREIVSTKEESNGEHVDNPDHSINKGVKDNTLQAEKAPLEMRFLDWVRHINENKVNPDEGKLTIDKKIELFDTFLAKSPKIESPKKDYNRVDLSSESWASNSELMTETLAKVFIKQKKYRKAIKAYEILRLKYPEKNGFFADQIEEIKKRQQQKE